jgi:hypothetical protein
LFQSERSRQGARHARRHIRDERPRWRANPQVGFIAPVIIVRGRRYHRKVDIEDFVDRLVEATASGEAATTAPNPHRTAAKKRQRVGGVVTG